jgi:peptidyl-prolyl cis-trans isomerase A (cyclophilin A)
MVVQALDTNGNVLLAKTVNVPAPLVVMSTTKGSILVQLDPTAAPISVKNFLKYTSNGFYAGSIFHRVIPGFVAQGGGFMSGLVALTQTFPNIALESNNGLHNVRGTIAMARTAAPDSANFQFYFNLVDNLSLDFKDANNPGYAVFGKVTQGLDVMDAIGAVPTSTFNGVSDVPVTDIVINGVTRIQ